MRTTQENLLKKNNLIEMLLLVLLISFPQKSFAEEFISLDGEVSSFHKSKGLVVIKSDGVTFRFPLDFKEYKNLKEGDEHSFNISTRFVEIKSGFGFKKIFENPN